MIYTVTANPALDYTITLEQLQKGTLNRAKKEQLRAGGKGINVSVMLSLLGEKSVPLGFTGGFTGEELEHLLHQKGIWTDFVRVEHGNTRINIKINAEEETELNGGGPLIGKEETEQFMQKLDRLEDGDYLVLSGSLAQSMEEGFYEDIMKEVQKKAVSVVVDTTNQQLMRTLSYRPFLVKPNEQELGELYGVQIQTASDAVLFGGKLREDGAQNVLVSRGENGAILLAADGSTYICGAPSGNVKGTVGCGDAMIAGFLKGYLKSGSYESAFYYAISSGSAWAFYGEKAGENQVEMLFLDFLRDKEAQCSCKSVQKRLQ